MTTDNPDPLEEDIARTLSCHLWATIVADNNDDCDEFDAMPDYIKDIYRRAAAAIIAQHYAPVIAENEAETGWLIEREGMGEDAETPLYSLAALREALPPPPQD